MMSALEAMHQTLLNRLVKPRLKFSDVTRVIDVTTSKIRVSQSVQILVPLSCFRRCQMSEGLTLRSA